MTPDPFEAHTCPARVGILDEKRVCEPFITRDPAVAKGGRQPNLWSFFPKWVNVFIAGFPASPPGAMKFLFESAEDNGGRDEKTTWTFSDWVDLTDIDNIEDRDVVESVEDI